mmetsp:Transcript_23380/g.43984  ORF Transcript_23380/g.43984 Transcript_23380/m.43984 type:complete len:106 (+) Transcript_23380:258-575(+)
MEVRRDLHRLQSATSQQNHRLRRPQKSCEKEGWHILSNHRHSDADGLAFCSRFCQWCCYGRSTDVSVWSDGQRHFACSGSMPCAPTLHGMALFSLSRVEVALPHV